MLPVIAHVARRLRWVAAVLAIIMPLAFPGAASADNSANAESMQYVSTSVTPVAGSDQEYDNSAVSAQTTSGQTAFTLTFKTPVTYASVITADNDATATANNCQNCTAIAISFQAVTTAKPELAELTANDVANATSTSCSNCNVLAEAFQIVYAPDSLEPGMIGGALLQLKEQFAGLQNPSLTLGQIQSKSNADVKTVLSELQNAATQGSMMTPGINDYDLQAQALSPPLVDLLSAFQL
jgi:hypothetical protein